MVGMRAVGMEAGMVVAVMVEAPLWERETMVEVLMVASTVAQKAGEVIGAAVSREVGTTEEGEAAVQVEVMVVVEGVQMAAVVAQEVV